MKKYIVTIAILSAATFVGHAQDSNKNKPADNTNTRNKQLEKNRTSPVSPNAPTINDNRMNRDNNGTPPIEHSPVPTQPNAPANPNLPNNPNDANNPNRTNNPNTPNNPMNPSGTPNVPSPSNTPTPSPNMPTNPTR